MWRLIIGWAAASLAVTADASRASAGLPDKAEFDLVCLGAGSGTEPGKSGASPQPDDAVGQRGSVDLWLNAHGGRIHFPFDFFGKGRTSGEWYELGSIEITSHQITGIVESRLFGRPKLWISRIDGTMTISLKDRQYVGMCSQFDAAKARRAF